MLTADSLAVIISATAAVFSAVTGFGFKITDMAKAARTRRSELYIVHCKSAYDAFIAAYSNLHMVKTIEEQRDFTNTLYTAISIAPDDLRCELTKLLSMNSVSSIKPNDENRIIFYRCLDLIGKYNAKFLS